MLLIFNFTQEYIDNSGIVVLPSKTNSFNINFLLHFGRRCVCQLRSWLRALHMLVLKLTTGCRQNTSHTESSSGDGSEDLSVLCKPGVIIYF